MHLDQALMTHSASASLRQLRLNLLQYRITDPRIMLKYEQIRESHSPCYVLRFIAERLSSD